MEGILERCKSGATINHLAGDSEEEAPGPRREEEGEGER